MNKLGRNFVRAKIKKPCKFVVQNFDTAHK